MPPFPFGGMSFLLPPMPFPFPPQGLHGAGASAAGPSSGHGTASGPSASSHGGHSGDAHASMAPSSLPTGQVHHSSMGMPPLLGALMMSMGPGAWGRQPAGAGSTQPQEGSEQAEEQQYMAYYDSMGGVLAQLVGGSAPFSGGNHSQQEQGGGPSTSGGAGPSSWGAGHSSSTGVGGGAFASGGAFGGTWPPATGAIAAATATVASAAAAPHTSSTSSSSGFGGGPGPSTSHTNLVGPWQQGGSQSQAINAQLPTMVPPPWMQSLVSFIRALPRGPLLSALQAQVRGHFPWAAGLFGRAPQGSAAQHGGGAIGGGAGTAAHAAQGSAGGPGTSASAAAAGATAGEAAGGAGPSTSQGQGARGVGPVPLGLGRGAGLGVPGPAPVGPSRGATASEYNAAVAAGSARWWGGAGGGGPGSSGSDGSEDGEGSDAWTEASSDDLEALDPAELEAAERARQLAAAHGPAAAAGAWGPWGPQLPPGAAGFPGWGPMGGMGPPPGMFTLLPPLSWGPDGTPMVGGVALPPPPAPMIQAVSASLDALPPAFRLQWEAALAAMAPPLDGPNAGPLDMDRVMQGLLSYLYLSGIMAAAQYGAVPFPAGAAGINMSGEGAPGQAAGPESAAVGVEEAGARQVEGGEGTGAGAAADGTNGGGGSSTPQAGDPDSDGAGPSSSRAAEPAAAGQGGSQAAGTGQQQGGGSTAAAAQVAQAATAAGAAGAAAAAAGPGVAPLWGLPPIGMPNAFWPRPPEMPPCALTYLSRITSLCVLHMFDTGCASPITQVRLCVNTVVDDIHFCLVLCCMCMHKAWNTPITQVRLCMV